MNEVERNVKAQREVWEKNLIILFLAAESVGFAVSIPNLPLGFSTFLLLLLYSPVSQLGERSVEVGSLVYLRRRWGLGRGGTVLMIFDLGE